MSKPTTFALLLPLVAALVVPGVEAQATRPCTVERVIDGDTFTCADGERVRLLLVDAPEIDDEPPGVLARAFVRGLLPPGARVRLETDVEVRDRYGRFLAYVHLPDGRLLNRVLARRGFAEVMVIPPNVGRLPAMRAAVDSARGEGAGLWAVEAFSGGSGGEGARPSRRDAGGGCHPSYPDVCIPAPPPDLDCDDVPRRSFRVTGSDPHRFDGDGNGVGCEGGWRAPPPGLGA